MAAVDTGSSEFTLTLTEEERTQLLSFLEQLHRNKLIEVHRTEATRFREHLEHQESVLESLIAKLRRA